jgi:hypothetical protein
MPPPERRTFLQVGMLLPMRTENRVDVYGYPVLVVPEPDSLFPGETCIEMQEVELYNITRCMSVAKQN